MELRRIEAADGPALHSIMSDPDVARWLRPAGVTAPFSLAECEDWVRKDAAHWDAFGFGAWLAYDGDAPVARGGLRHTIADARAEVELAWAVRSSHHRRGIATLLGRRGLDVARERGIEGVVAFTNVENGASRRVAERLGLTLECAFTHAGIPHVLYRKMRPIR